MAQQRNNKLNFPPLPWIDGKMPKRIRHPSLCLRLQVKMLVVPAVT